MTETQNKPTHTAYVVREAKQQGGKGYWMEIGSAWAHDDGKGFNIQLEAAPIGGKIVLRERTERQANEPAQGDQPA